ncbi:MAG TPA: hypothetical protein VHM26_17340 [Chitinophagaceae bacterium]|nr:hypothetical protein [Chitinophagaceae bacterium]
MKKRYYAPGMISLIGLFIYFSTHSIKMPPESGYTAIQLSFPKKYDLDENMVFSHAFINKELNDRRVMSIEFDSDHATNRNKIDFIRHETRRIAYTKDSTTGIIVHFNSDVSYEDMIRLVDMAQAEIDTYGIMDTVFFLFYRPSPPGIVNTLPEFICISGSLSARYEKEIASKKKSCNWITFRHISLSAGWLLLAISGVIYSNPYKRIF